ncbi:tape-measure protein [Streptomyces spinoverrucosus]|uniref:tape-measure protein n=1 Tax=Streptomyces spinoverrucosus TaxID=284043 RepID=UPI0018C3B0A2|nr:tape-measure protein [Streptomyces spinoverrucosus]MBG0853216.1 tape-measure protein [Streptomyces spinoverrucosus]
MSAAAAIPLNPLAGVAPALRTFRTGLDQGAGTLASLTSRVKSTVTATDRVRTAAAQGGTALRQMKTNAEAAARSVGRLGQGTATGVKSVGAKAKAASRALAKLKGTGLLTLIGGFVAAAGVVGALLSAFGTAMTIGAVVLAAVNALTRANPLGFVLGLLLPVAGWLIDLALNSETGQRLMRQLATLVLKYVEGYLAVIGPVMKTVGSVVSTYVKGWLALIKGVITGIGAVVGTGFAVLKALTTGDTRALSGKVSAVWRGFKDAVRPAVQWITRDVPRMFSRVKEATAGTLGAIGRFVTTGAQTVAGVIKGPINGLIAFANWVIDGLNSLSFSILGKKFGVDLDKIPMLAEGGVAVPGAARRAGKVLPLTALERQRTLAAERPRHPYRIREFHETSGARSTAEDLLFLASAHART